MSDKRIHGQAAAGVGDLGAVTADEVVGPCPSCGAELVAGQVRDPRTGRVGRALLHPMPFCTYYGETDPATIEQDVSAARSRRSS